jgi:hypothetical protein
VVCVCREVLREYACTPLAQKESRWLYKWATWYSLANLTVLLASYMATSRLPVAPAQKARSERGVALSQSFSHINECKTTIMIYQKECPTPFPFFLNYSHAPPATP